MMAKISNVSGGAGFITTTLIAQLTSKINLVAFQAGVDLIKKKFESGIKIITCGNGGGASTTSYYIIDWDNMINPATGGKFRRASLCDNVGLITAYGNDISHDEVFAGKLKAIMDESDLLVEVVIHQIL